MLHDDCWHILYAREGGRYTVQCEGMSGFLTDSKRIVQFMHNAKSPQQQAITSLFAPLFATAASLGVCRAPDYKSSLQITRQAPDR